MKKIISVLLASLFISVLANAATWTVGGKEATLSASSDWRAVQSVGILLKGETHQILSQYDDWVEVTVKSSKVSNNVGKTGYVWIKALNLASGVILAPGANLLAAPGNDVAGARVSATQIGLLWEGDVVTIKGYTRATWYQIQVVKKGLTNTGWVYAPLGTVKQ